MKSWKSNFVALLIAVFFALTGFNFTIPIIPLFLQETIGIEDPVKLKAWVGIIQAGSSISMAICAPIWGHLADIFSRKTMLLRAMFGGAVVVSLFGFVTAPWQLLVLRIIQGCITGITAAATVLTATISPPAQVAFTLGLLQTGIGVGYSVGPLVGGLLSDLFGHRVAFFSTGAMLAVTGLIILKWVEDDNPASNGKERKKFTLIPDIKPIIGSSLLITMMLVTLSLQAATRAADPMIPLFVKELAEAASEVPMRMGMASTSGMVLGIGAAFTALAAVIAGKFSSRLGYWRTLIFCLAAGAVTTLLQMFVHSIFELTVLRALSSFFIGGATPVVSALIALSASREHHGLVYGVNSSLSAVGGALGPIVGAASAMMNYRMVFLASAVILGLCVVRTAVQKKS